MQDAALSDSDGEMLGAAGRVLLMSTLCPSSWSRMMSRCCLPWYSSLGNVWSTPVASRLQEELASGTGRSAITTELHDQQEVAAHKADAQQKQLKKVTLDSFSKLKLSLPGVVSRGG